MLNGAAVLVVEAEFLIALDLQRMLESSGAGEVLLARNADEAGLFRAHWNQLGLAVIEASRVDESVIRLAGELRAAGVPLVLCSADASPRFVAAELSGLPVLTKPMLESDMARAVTTALAMRR